MKTVLTTVKNCFYYSEKLFLLQWKTVITTVKSISILISNNKFPFYAKWSRIFYLWKLLLLFLLYLQWFITERGECSFVSKTIKAQEAGALAAIISDIDEKQDELFVSMVDDTTERTVKIPSAYLLGKNG